jgi:hypothetical protein
MLAADRPRRAVTAVAVPAPAQAAPIAVDFLNVTGSTHLAKPDVDVTVPKSTVRTQVDLDAKTVTGTAELAASRTRALTAARPPTMLSGTGRGVPHRGLHTEAS